MWCRSEGLAAHGAATRCTPHVSYCTGRAPAGEQLNESTFGEYLNADAQKSKKNYLFYLCGNGGELERLEGLVVGGGARVDVDHHARASVTTEEALEDSG